MWSAQTPPAAIDCPILQMPPSSPKPLLSMYKLLAIRVTTIPHTTRHQVMYNLKCVSVHTHFTTQYCCSAYGPHCKCMSFSSAMAHYTHTHTCASPFLPDQMNYLCRYSVSNECHTVRMYVCMRVCLRVCMCVHVCACADVYISICIAKHITRMWLSCCICQSLITHRLLYCTVSICVCMCMCLHRRRHLTCCATDEA